MNGLFPRATLHLSRECHQNSSVAYPSNPANKHANLIKKKKMWRFLLQHFYIPFFPTFTHAFMTNFDFIKSLLSFLGGFFCPHVQPHDDTFFV